VVDIDAMPTSVVGIAQREIGETKIVTPSTYQMARKVSEATGKSLALDLYKRLYAPLPTLFAHANGLVLMRHVGNKANLQAQPSYPWVRRSAVRICDVSVGILAWAVWEKSDLPTQMFADHTNAHMRRSLTPIFAMGLRNAGGHSGAKYRDWFRQCGSANGMSGQMRSGSIRRRLGCGR
jgi:hypothetical protein